MEFKILGGLEIVSNGSDITPSAPKLRRVLCLLLLHPNQIVQTAALIDELWGDEPVRSAMTTMQTYIYLLRKTFGHESDLAENILVTKPSGYIVHTPPESVDLFRFEALAEKGRQALRGGDAEQARTRLAEALALWRGPALADVQTGRLLEAHVTRLEEGRLRTLELRIEADLRCGQHRELISELKALTTSHPYHEAFYQQLMLALYRSGRQCEALDAYGRLRKAFVKDLGVEPSVDLRRLQHSILGADPTLDLQVPAPARAVTVERGPRPPSQLPPDIADFTARSDVVSMAEAVLTGEDTERSNIVQLVGMPGVGKTACSVRIAHRVRSRFPDGQVYASLRGSEDDPVPYGDVLRGFLRAMGVHDTDMPDSLPECAEAFRGHCAGRRMLVVLDDVASADQVAALLPGGDRCGVLVTSRGPLEGLPGTCAIKVGVMAENESVDLLAGIVGRERVSRGREAAKRIVQLCDNLPLAVRAAGARLAAVPALSLDRFSAQLVDERRRLSQLGSSDFDVRAQFEATYQRLPEADRSAARWLSLFANRSFTARGASILLSQRRDATDRLLEKLAEVHFVQRLGPDASGQVYYRFFELPRALLCDHAMGTLLEGLRAC
ncbi:AfsR/SARP family transcriptional regulator [Sphaerisporangium sp. TRM90804]|uniref:AfsR/SARP family transcriptional regulator n=1 Tax=Sphaerisporangium sp. TRM90804 TaxID=3031113 RepID=UPI0024470517|nr:AfsR/SARP family transcriptional regulator [Sphaerisporangium sp. TRM90804]MDH2427205.1 BTAD domain-containing putative transcriptional regulator [Sphaerisporangium sp. TRM90804]